MAAPQRDKVQPESREVYSRSDIPCLADATGFE